MRRWLVVLGLALAAPPAAFGDAPRVADERIVFHTSLGDAVFALYPDVAPIHVAQIAEPIVITAVQIHHFFVDGVIWKLRNPSVGSPMLVNLEQLARGRSALQPA